MKPLQFALVIIAVIFLPAYWLFVPGFRTGILSAIHLINSFPWWLGLIGALVAVIIINTRWLQSKAQRRA